MKIPSAAFNFFFLAVLLFAVAGCKTPEEKEKAKRAASLRFHLETNPDGTPHNQQVPVYRASPMFLQVETGWVLDEGHMSSIEIVDVDEHGGWGIKVTFDEAGRRRLENITTAHKGRRLGVYARWTESRWLAAPLITRNLTNGVFIFTPDATREEAQLIVEGVGNIIKKLKKPYIF